MQSRYLAWLVLAAPLCCGLLAAAPAPQRVQVGTGLLEGRPEGGAVAFLGVPYAAPPVGTLRWRAPAPAAPWRGVREAVEFAASCPQVINPPAGRGPWTPEYLIPGPTSEDCLYLNVWRPAARQPAPAPILFWIHGGGLREGSGSVPVYDGAALAAQGIVVVTINYRLGVLGFLAHPDLAREQPHAAGNYGLQDILAALRWVRANAGAFGGDAARITIAGQSAGATAVQSLIASPLAAGLFARAIAESGAGWSADLPGWQRAAAQGEAFARSIGAGSLDALRGMAADELVAAGAAFVQATGTPFGSVIDGHLLRDDPKRALLTGRFNDTPVMAGINADEGSGLRAAGDYGRLDLQAFERRRGALFGTLAPQAARLYAAASDAEAGAADIRMTRERARAWTYEWAQRRAMRGRQPIYLYVYDHVEPGPDAGRYGAFHSSEVPYVFQTLDAAPRPFTPEDRRISALVSGRWLAFLRGKSPDLPGQPHWPAFSAQAPVALRLGDAEGVEPLLAPGQQALYDALVEQGGTLALY